MAGDVAAIRDIVRAARRAGRSVGLVPTMGALHAGHISLVEAARADCDLVVVSIFVNPLQFGAGEDLSTYPRTFEEDLALLAAARCDAVFHPSAAEFTPEGRLTTVSVAGLTMALEARTRPTHFDGVTTIVAKLLNAVAPDRAYFGEKDFQQQAIIRRMVADLDMPVEIVTCPVVRDEDGLALSSRNRYLTAEERRHALALSRSLRETSADWDGSASSARSTLVDTLSTADGIRLDYAEVIDPETLTPLEGVHDGPAQGVVAAFVGSTRLIDTMRLDVPAT